MYESEKLGRKPPHSTFFQADSPSIEAKNGRYFNPNVFRICRDKPGITWV
jgi:hypothetical protein